MVTDPPRRKSSKSFQSGKISFAVLLADDLLNPTTSIRDKTRTLRGVLALISPCFNSSVWKLFLYIAFYYRRKGRVRGDPVFRFPQSVFQCALADSSARESAFVASYTLSTGALQCSARFFNKQVLRGRFPQGTSAIPCLRVRLVIRNTSSYLPLISGTCIAISALVEN